jgi:hypothetical protein
MEVVAMKKLIQILILGSLLLVLVPAIAFAHTAADPFVTDLTAGGGNIMSAKDVGDVLVWNDDANLYVKYVVTDGDWCLTETHLQIALELGGIPQANGNPIPGQFTYGGWHNCVGDYTYQIPISWDPGTELLIAAHGVVQTGGMGGVGGMLPTQVTMATAFPGLGFGAPSYFDLAISGGTVLDGTYDGYCLDTDSANPDPGPAYVHSSYGPLPQTRIEYPENLDLVNWIINQGFVGQPSSCDGVYTYGDVQWAIWNLLEDNPTPGALGSLGDWSECRAQEIVAAAYANGEGFVPGCGDMMGIIVIRDGEWWRYQPILIWIEVPCAESETAWGGDYFGSRLEFPGDNWAIYFTYDVQ